MEVFHMNIFIFKVPKLSQILKLMQIFLSHFYSQTCIPKCLVQVPPFCSYPNIIRLSLYDLLDELSQRVN